ncbi:hypothetical protein [Campylobacter anatolicus]|nr:hypothetical protein [Campylobacter anatolicus]
MKNLAFLLMFLVFLMGCEDKKTQILEQNDSVPADIPISHIDANVSIDETLPPEPAIEGVADTEKQSK